MEQNKEFEQIIFEDCVSAIIDNSEGKEISHFPQRQGGSFGYVVIQPVEKDKTLEFKVQFDNYEFKYISKSDTIVLSNNDFTPTFIPIRLGVNPTVAATPREPPFLILERGKFGKSKLELFHTKLFNSFLKFASTYNQMKNLQKELADKDNVKKVNKSKI